MLSPSLFLPYLLFALVVTAVAARRAKTPQRKRWITVGLLGFFCVFAFVDDILGGIQHRWLCHKEAGFFVYSRADLPQEFYDASGNPTFYKADGIDKDRLKGYLNFDWQVIRNYRSSFQNIDKRIFKIIDKHTDKVIAENISFFAWPSEFVPTISHISANDCFDSTDELARWSSWEAEIFRSK